MTHERFSRLTCSQTPSTSKIQYETIDKFNGICREHKVLTDKAQVGRKDTIGNSHVLR